MKDFEFCCPTDFVFGRDAELQVGEKLAADGAHKVMVHYGRNSVIASGLLGRVVESLQAAGLDVVQFGGVRPNPEVELIREGIALVREQNIDYLLAVGGGSVVDSAKGIAAGVHYDGDVWDLYGHGLQPLNHGTVPFSVVLTIPAAGSEASMFTVVSNDELGLKSSLSGKSLRSHISFMNPELTCSLPAYQTAAGSTDMYAHLLERFFGDGVSVSVTDHMLLGLMKTVRSHVARALAEPHDYEARANLMWAGMLAHCGIAGCGRQEDWASHALEHELSAFDPTIAHGAGLAVIFPAWMRYVYREDPARFALYGREVFGIADSGDTEADALRAIEATSQFFTSLGMPSTLSELGVSAEDIPTFLPTLRTNKGDSFGGFKTITVEEAADIYQLAL